MFSNFIKIQTSSLNEYAKQLNERATSSDDISFPCGTKLKGGVSLRGMFGLTRNTDEMPASMKCGDTLRGEESVVCRHCYAEYDHQKSGDVESIPLRGSKAEAQKEVGASGKENGLVRFAKNHPYLVAGMGFLFTAGAVCAAINTYKSASETAPEVGFANAPQKLSAYRGDSPETGEAVSNTTTPVTTASNTTTPYTTAAQDATASNAITLDTTTLDTTASNATTPDTTTTSATTTDTTTTSATTPDTTTTSATTIVGSTTSPVRVKTIDLKVHNVENKPVNVTLTGCEIGDNSVVGELQPGKELTLSCPIGKDFQSLGAWYTRDREEGEGDETIKYKCSVNNSPCTDGDGIVTIAKKDNINSLDKNGDGKLRVRHTLLNFEGADRLDQVFEGVDGQMPKYAGVTVEGMKLVLDNRFPFAAAYFVGIGKGANKTTQYNQVYAYFYQEIKFPKGIHQLQVGEASYPKRTFDGQALNKALADSKVFKQTACITAQNVPPTYLSNIKYGRCGR